METIEENLLQLKLSVRKLEEKYGICANKIKIMAVTKGSSIEKIKIALSANQKIFGESYLQEALNKIKIIDNKEIEWHFIGRIQSNKTKLIALNFSWIDSVSNYQIVQLLNKYRPNNMQNLNICIQVNINNDPHKSGITLDNILPFAKKITKLSKINLRGLMTIPTYYENFKQQYLNYSLLAEKFKLLKKEGIDMDVLNIGMSHDYEAAIAAGATIIRIGRSIFNN